jgi:tetratricopeptide (TPR) repeat protein
VSALVQFACRPAIPNTTTNPKTKTNAKPNTNTKTDTKTPPLGGSMLTAVAVLLALQAPAAPPTDPIDLVKQGRKLVADGRIDEGLALYDKAIAASPDLLDAHLAAGIALDLTLDFRRARAHLSKALELSTADERAQVLSSLAVSYAFEGKAREAATFYARLLDAQTSTSDFAGAAATANALGRVYLETGSYAEARRWYESGYEYSRRQEKSPGAQLELWDFRWLHAKARVAAREGRKQEAAALTAEAKALLDRTPSLAPETATWQYLAGYVALHAKDHGAAIAALQAADQRDPFVLSLLARAYEETHEPARARETWEKVLASRAHNLQNAFARPQAMKALK